MDIHRENGEDLNCSKIHFKLDHVLATFFALSLATGSFGAIFSTAIICLFAGVRAAWPWRPSVGFFLVVLFCISNVLLYKSVDVDFYPYMSVWWQTSLSLSLFLSFLFGYRCMRRGMFFYCITIIVVVCVSYGVLAILLALIYMQLPLDGLVFDPINWREGGSGSRASNYIAMLPILFAAFILAGNNRLKNPILVCLLAAICILIGLVVDKRLYILTVFIVLPIFSVFLKFYGPYKKGIVLALASLLAFILIFDYFGFFEKTYAEYSLNGGRFWLYESYIRQLVSDPFGNFVVPSSLVESPIWFHNMFMDVSRLSGIFPAAILIALIIFYLYKISVLRGTSAFYCNALFLLIFMFTFVSSFSVVPEGEIQFMIAIFYFCGAGEYLINTKFPAGSKNCHVL